ncbi:putative metal-binding motif-containing protein [Myxococcus eversor]|uniref:putative metal-binding motif-containing protein n=1 Tax=Myxococcus eversor TaxID=2709661 RepID=UPI001F07C8E7|nr:putative metal-binding motif-containing protein [Myxococcus eversor]
MRRGILSGMQARHVQAGVGLLLLAVLAAACGSSGSKNEGPRDSGPSVVEDAGGDGGRPEDAGGTVSDAGPDGGVPEDAGTPEPDAGAPEDAGTLEDAGTPEPDGGVEPLACEKTHGVCAGARRAWVDGAYEAVCTGRSYGADYEEGAETRCDGLDNDCDGVTDPSIWSRVTSLETALGRVSSLKTDSGVFVSIGDNNRVLILRLSSELAIQGTASVSMPWIRTGAEAGLLQHAQLVRTEAGFALHYSTAALNGAAPLRAYLVPLDARGAPTPLPEGGLVEHLLLDRASDSGSTRVATSVAGDKVVVIWRSGSAQSPPMQVMGTVTDAQGQVLIAPKSLFTSEGNVTQKLANALWLRNGEILVGMSDERSGLTGDTVRLRRFDANLDPVGAERSFETSYEAMPLLLDLGSARGGPLASPVLVLRVSYAPDWTRQLQVVQNLFGGGGPEKWAEAPTTETVWYGALADEGVLRLGWLAEFKDHEAPPPGGDDWLGWNGRLWTLDEGQAAVDRSPDSEYLPLHRYAQWVLMEKLAPRRVGAMYMTTTPDGSSLDSVRYCTP